MHSFRHCENDLLKALEINPNNSIVRREMNVLKMQLVLSRARDFKISAGITKLQKSIAKKLENQSDLKFSDHPFESISNFFPWSLKRVRNILIYSFLSFSFYDSSILQPIEPDISYDDNFHK